MSKSTPPQHAKQRLQKLRSLMAKRKLDAVIVLRQDEYQGDCVAAYAERLRWLTGFAGSWGVAVVTAKTAAIFVDGRYTLQVKDQVDVKLFTPCSLIDNPPSQWLTENLKKAAKVGFDPNVTSMHDAKRLRLALDKAGIKLVALPGSPIDEIWDDQPARPDGVIVAHPPRFAGKSTAAKLADAGKALKSQGHDAVVLGDPASVCWALNIRGSDVPFTPFVLATAIISSAGKATLFIDKKRVPRGVLASGVTIVDPSLLEKTLKAMGRKKQRISLDPALLPEQVRLTLVAAGASIHEAQDPCVIPKACKNKVERQGARNAQLRDGAALTTFLHWLDTTAHNGGISERMAADRLRACREATGKLRDLSFETIPAAGPHAASPHYHLGSGAGPMLKPGEVFLVDSGAQYEDGTTDVTRTIMIGPPTDEIRDRFTRVLKGMIGISMLRFPKGTSGFAIDAVARAALWKAGLDFDHGTGHGVGSYLSVHEGPVNISKAGHAEMLPGMILSNEPGYYKAGHFGIRIENLLLVTEAEKIEGGDRAMLGFETLTLAPIDRNLIDTKLLTRDELHWLDGYHARVLREISPLVSEPVQAWLTQVCAPFNRD